MLPSTDTDLTQKSQQIFAWCSCSSNNIRIYDCTRRELITTIKGPPRDDSIQSPLIEQIPNTNYLISSVTYRQDTQAIFKIFDFGNKMKTCFDLGIADGSNFKILLVGSLTSVFNWTVRIGIKEIACNQKKGYIALLSTGMAIVHIFDSSNLRFVKKLKQSPTGEGADGEDEDFLNFIWPNNQAISLSFDPEGNHLCIFQATGEFCILNVLDASRPISIVLPTLWGSISNNKCRWNPVIDSCVAVKYAWNRLKMIDVERGLEAQSLHVELDSDCTWSLEWDQSGELLVSCGNDKDVKIYDRRQGKVSKLFNIEFPDWTWSTKWSPCGNLLSVLSGDRRITIIEFRSGKILYEELQEEETGNFCWLTDFDLSEVEMSIAFA